MAAQPERTCIGCRAVVPASGMVRLVAPDGCAQVMTAHGPAGLARTGKAGRGAWVHLDCLAQAIERGAMARAFRRRVEIGEQLARLARTHGASGRSSTSGNSR
jgi:predicted RNA-binding protein YlxR (DUF448 family)